MILVNQITSLPIGFNVQSIFMSRRAKFGVFKMAVSFFQSLNPASENSGVLYPSYVADEDYLGQEIIDRTVSENISYISEQFNPGFRYVFEILVGAHYSFGYLGQCSKGILDYLIFPLVSRKILHETEESNIFVKTLAWSIALPLELGRFSLAIGLTLLVAPIIKIINLCTTSGCLSQDEVNSSRDCSPA